MAIAFDAATDGGQTGGSPASITFSHTTGAGSDRALFVAAIGNDGAPGSVSQPTVTYNGSSMTFLGTQVGTSPAGVVFVFYMVAPDTGTHDVVITQGATKASFLSGLAESFSGVDQSNPIDDHGGASDGSGGSLTITKTLDIVNDWGVIFVTGESNIEAGTNITERVDTVIHYFCGDTNGDLSSGSQSIAVTIAANNGGAYGAFFSPVQIVDDSSWSFAFV